MLVGDRLNFLDALIPATGQGAAASPGLTRQLKAARTLAVCLGFPLHGVKRSSRLGRTIVAVLRLTMVTAAIAAHSATPCRGMLSSRNSMQPAPLQWTETDEVGG